MMQVGGFKDNSKGKNQENLLIGSTMMNSREFALKLNKYVG